MTEKRDYTDFDKFIRAKIREGKIHIDSDDRKLKEELLRLGIRRVATYDKDGRKYVDNAYPKQSQLDHVKDVIHQQKHAQQKVDLYFTHEYGFRAKEIIYHKGKIYRKGQFLPKDYIYKR